MLLRLFTLCVLLLTGPAVAQVGPPAARDADERRELRAARILESWRGREAALVPWLRRMPKGADLHSHLSGAVYAESYLKWAAEDGLCVDVTQGALVPGPECRPPLMSARDLAAQDRLYDLMLRRMSMRDFRGQDPQAEPSGHRQFFVTFERFSAATAHRTGDMLAEVAQRAADHGVQYLELMLSPGMGEAARGTPDRKGQSTDGASPVTPHSGSPEDWAQRWALDRIRLEGLAARVSQDLDRVITRQRELLHCDEPARARTGCGVEVRFLAQVRRVLSVDQVFAQASLGFELVRRDPRFVGLNLVAPEHHPLALAGYEAQMQALGWLRARWPQVPIALHAGELVWGLVAPEHLRSHIRLAVEVAGARRIGHGVSIAHEDDALELLNRMAAKQVTVEINLTSNDFILGVRGNRHPLHLYLRHGVPLVLSTDDEGVSRIDITHEYLRAMTEQGLDYRQLKRMARQSLMSAFIDGQSLWLAPSTPSGPLRRHTDCARWDQPSCRALLERSPRARLQYEQERAFVRFEDELIRSGR